MITALGITAIILLWVWIALVPKEPEYHFVLEVPREHRSVTSHLSDEVHDWLYENNIWFKFDQGNKIRFRYANQAVLFKMRWL